MPLPPSSSSVLGSAKDRLRSLTDELLQRLPSDAGEPGRIETSPWAQRLASVRRGLIEFGTDRLAVRTGATELHSAYGDVKVTRKRGWIWDRIGAEDVRTGAKVEVEGIRKREAVSAEAALEASLLLRAVQRVNAALDELLQRDAYLTRRAYLKWRSAADALYEGGGAKILQRVSELPVAERSKHQARRFLQRYDDGEVLVDRRNADYARSVLERYQRFFEVVEAQPLTSRQRDAIVHDEDACLVVAGAGTGKTSTVVAKAGFLLMHDGLPPESILALAFNRKAAEEMRERIHRRCGAEIPVHTFHSLGLSIIASAEGRKPSLSPLAEDERRRTAALRRYLNELLDSERDRDKVVRFLAHFRYPERYEWEFTERQEYLRYMQAHRPTTLRGEFVKSWGELQIADWLCLNGIPYEYEAKYPVDLASETRRQYKPDFTLPNRTFIEYFGIDRHGKTAPGVDATRYNAGMKWKREIHKEHGTELVEFFAYEAMEGTLDTSIGGRLREAGIKPSPLSAEEVRDLVARPQRIDPLGSLLGTFLSLFKGNQWTLAEIRDVAAKHPHSARMIAFVDVFELVLAKYEEEVHSAGDIDFDDMILRATQHLEQGRFASPYRRIIVDEFQDISRGRARLLQALVAGTGDSRIFAVGDDWQSIYRFAGSDISVMTSFADHFGHTHRTDLDRTFRYDHRLLEVSTRFILKNPHQLRKQVTARGGLGGPVVTVLSYADSRTLPLGEALQDIRLRKGGNHGTSVLLLGRYNHLMMPEDLAQLRSDHSDLQLDYRTVHSAKGLEADFVVVLGLTARPPYSFPSEIEDDPVLELVLPAEAGFHHAEERRLFYVAVTRARKHVYLISERPTVSAFVAELRGPAYRGMVEFRAPSDAPQSCCERCGSPDLVPRTGPHGPFLGCGFYPYCRPA